MALPIEAVNDFVVKFANVNGSGSASANELFARAILRNTVAFYDKDRFFAPDINAASELLASRCLNELVPTNLLPSL